MVASKFLSTPSARRATFDSIDYISNQEFLSTPSARRATRSPWKSLTFPRYFYPRPPRGGRLSAERAESAGRSISIHALREEGDAELAGTGLKTLDFYPRPPRGGRPAGARGYAACGRISIHALREEGDTPPQPACAICSYFYPRPPRGGRPSIV